MNKKKAVCNAIHLGFQRHQSSPHQIDEKLN